MSEHDARMPFDLADHTFGHELNSKEATTKICPLFIACSQETCRYWKPMKTAYKYIFCYNCWEGAWDGYKIYKGGMAISEDPIVRKAVKDFKDAKEDKGITLNGEFIELVEIDGEVIP